MHKDFDKWNSRKKEIHVSIPSQVLFHEREIWWCVLGTNIGSEQDGLNEFFERPVLVLKKFNQQVLWVLPLTRTYKSNPYYVPLSSSPDQPSCVILSQIRLVSSKRLLRKMGTINKEEFAEIIERIKGCLPVVQ